MAIRVKQLTIFQKMLVAPMVGVLLYSTYLVYLYGAHQQNNATISALRDHYLPVLAAANENLVLFGSVADAFKDAVLAGEPEWVENTAREKQKVELNLARLNNYPAIVPAEQQALLVASFDAYYDNAYGLSMGMLTENTDVEQMNRLIENVEHYHARVASGFEQLNEDLQQRFSQHLNTINQRSHQLVLLGAALGVAVILVIIGVSFALSLSARKSLKEVNTALKNIARDDPDFSARLRCHRNDELGELVNWFNLLADKLEDDYKKIESLSVTDTLTQLANRAKIDDLFQLELNKAKRYLQPFSVILLDIDHFKWVNDTHGHLVGDSVLQQLAEILRTRVRNTDHSGRWGGEEFIIIASNTGLEQASQLAEKLREAIAVHEFGPVGQCTASFGVACYQAGDDVNRITKRADDCLYIAKQRGRNCVVIESSPLILPF